MSNEQRPKETHVCGNCGAQTHSLVGQLQADGSWHCFNCSHGNSVALSSNPLAMPDQSDDPEDNQYSCSKASALVAEIERLTREVGRLDALRDSAVKDCIEREKERDRLRAALAGFDDFLTAKLPDGTSWWSMTPIEVLRAWIAAREVIEPRTADETAAVKRPDECLCMNCGTWHVVRPENGTAQ